MGETVGYGLVALVAALIAGSVGFAFGVVVGAARSADLDRQAAFMRAQSEYLRLPSGWEEHPSNHRRRLRVVADEPEDFPL
jgi:hypothetical protein